MRGLTLALAAIIGLNAPPVVALDLSGVLKPKLSLSVRATRPGRIATLKVEEGDIVPAGSLLFEIDSTIQKARVDLARVVGSADGAILKSQQVLDQAKQTYARIEVAKERGAVKAWEVEQAKQSVLLAEADLVISQDQAAQNKAQLDLELATLRDFAVHTPFDAIVFERFFDPGETVDVGTDVLEIGNLDTLEAIVFSDFDGLDTLKNGATVSGRVDQADGMRVTGTVVFVDPRVDPVSQTFRVRIEVENPDRTIPVGSNLTVQIP